MAREGDCPTGSPRGYQVKLRIGKKKRGGGLFQKNTGPEASPMPRHRGRLSVATATQERLNGAPGYSTPAERAKQAA